MNADNNTTNARTNTSCNTINNCFYCGFYDVDDELCTCPSPYIRFLCPSLFGMSDSDVTDFICSRIQYNLDLLKQINVIS